MWRFHVTDIVRWQLSAQSVMQGNAVPHLQFMAESDPPPQLVIMLGKGTPSLSGTQT